MLNGLLTVAGAAFLLPLSRLDLMQFAAVVCAVWHSKAARRRDARAVLLDLLANDLAAQRKSNNECVGCGERLTGRRGGSRAAAGLCARCRRDLDSRSGRGLESGEE